MVDGNDRHEGRDGRGGPGERGGDARGGKGAGRTKRSSGARSGQTRTEGLPSSRSGTRGRARPVGPAVVAIVLPGDTAKPTTFAEYLRTHRRASVGATNAAYARRRAAYCAFKGCSAGEFETLVHLVVGEMRAAHPTVWVGELEAWVSKILLRAAKPPRGYALVRTAAAKAVIKGEGKG